MQGWSAGTMCSYMSIHIDGYNPNGTYVPSCANEYLLNDVVREYWNRPDATHLSDCGAVWWVLSFLHPLVLCAVSIFVCSKKNKSFAWLLFAENCRC